MTSKFLNYCVQFKTDMVEKANFRFQPGGIDKGWKLDVPVDKITDFWDKYHEYKVETGDQSHLMELPGKEFNILKLNIDLKHIANQEDLQYFKTKKCINPHGSKLKHKYTQELLKDIIKLYALSALKYIELPANCTFTIFEKKNAICKCKDDYIRAIENPYELQNDEDIYVKDGVHIMCPEIIATNTVLHAIYDQFIKMPALEKVYEKFQNVEPIEVMFDSKVISTNAWFSVGSGKPEDNKDYYSPTKTYKIVSIQYLNGDIDIDLHKIKLELSQREQISYFSAIGKSINIIVNSGINVEQQPGNNKSNIPIMQHRIKDPVTNAQNSHQSMEEQPLTPSELITLKDGYDEKRRVAYETAYAIGCANYIKYINDKLKKSNNEVYIDVYVYISMQEKPLLAILNEYRCKTYDTQLINKVNEHIKKAYEAFGVTVLPGGVIGDTLRIKIPQTVTPFN